MCPTINLYPVASVLSFSCKSEWQNQRPLKYRISRTTGKPKIWYQHFFSLVNCHPSLWIFLRREFENTLHMNYPCGNHLQTSMNRSIRYSQFFKQNCLMDECVICFLKELSLEEGRESKRNSEIWCNMSTVSLAEIYYLYFQCGN